MNREKWCSLLRVFWVEESEERGIKCERRPEAPCPGWFVSCPMGLAICTDRAHYDYRSYADLCMRAVRWMRATNLIREAPCGSSTCEACFLVLDGTAPSRQQLEEMSAEDRSVHVVLFAAMKGELV